MNIFGANTAKLLLTMYCHLSISPIFSFSRGWEMFRLCFVLFFTFTFFVIVAVLSVMEV